MNYTKAKQEKEKRVWIKTGGDGEGCRHNWLEYNQEAGRIYFRCQNCGAEMHEPSYQTQKRNHIGVIGNGKKMLND